VDEGRPVKIALAFGTRPEAIKMAPVIAALRTQPDVITEVVLTAQHRELLDQVLAVFGVRADHDLDIMQPRQSLPELTSRLILALDTWLEQSRPDLLMVQGDTTSAFIGALAAFYRGVPVAHVEAGLRTPDPVTPFPEEMNRRLVTRLAALHFAPTEQARRALLAEGVNADAVFVTGNTVVDALQTICESPALARTTLPIELDPAEAVVLVTMHRRESWDRIGDVCAALADVVSARPNVRVVFPVHPNPAVREAVRTRLAAVDRIDLIDPLDYLAFVKLMQLSRVIVTDSGGVQEEAPVLGRPVLVLRETTERNEAIEAGVAQLVGTSRHVVAAALLRLLDDSQAWHTMATPSSPFGDGRAAARIVSIINDERGRLGARARAGRPALAQ
jgi:UDP-N-acetylglucosamine 2-epimerase (non-hydrolysing)